MNIHALRQLVDELRKISASGSGNSVVVYKVDMETLLELATEAIDTHEHSRKGIAMLDFVAPVSRFEDIEQDDRPTLAPIPDGLWEELHDDDDVVTKPDNAAPVPVRETASDEMLRMMHTMVADLCIELGDDPKEVPCDIWRLREVVIQMRGDCRALSRAWNFFESREDPPEKTAAAAARAASRTDKRYPSQLVTPERAREIGMMVREEFRVAKQETEDLMRRIEDINRQELGSSGSDARDLTDKVLGYWRKLLRGSKP